MTCNCETIYVSVATAGPTGSDGGGGLAAGDQAAIALGVLLLLLVLATCVVCFLYYKGRHVGLARVVTFLIHTLGSSRQTPDPGVASSFSASHLR